MGARRLYEKRWRKQEKRKIPDSRRLCRSLDSLRLAESSSGWQHIFLVTVIPIQMWTLRMDRSRSPPPRGWQINKWNEQLKCCLSFPHRWESTSSCAYYSRISSAKSLHSGFFSSISRIFHSLFHFFNCFSRVIAHSILFPYSKYTSW